MPEMPDLQATSGYLAVFLVGPLSRSVGDRSLEPDESHGQRAIPAEFHRKPAIMCVCRATADHALCPLNTRAIDTCGRSSKSAIRMPVRKPVTNAPGSVQLTHKRKKVPVEGTWRSIPVADRVILPIGLSSAIPMKTSNYPALSG